MSEIDVLAMHIAALKAREDAIEECARVAESCVIASAKDVWAIAAAIRALKS